MIKKILKMCSISPGVHKTQRREKNLNSALSPYLPSSFLVVFVRAFPQSQKGIETSPRTLILTCIASFVSSLHKSRNRKKEERRKTRLRRSDRRGFTTIFLLFSPCSLPYIPKAIKIISKIPLHVVYI